MEVQIRGTVYDIPQGTSYRQLAARFQPEYDNDIVLVTVNGKLQELHKTVQFPCSLEFVTTGEKAGAQSYERSLILLMNKAIYDLKPLEDMEKVNVKFSVTHGL